MKNLILTMAIMDYMETMSTNIMPKNIYISLTNMTKKNKIIILTLSLILASCSLTPGMHMTTKKSIGSSEEKIYIESLNSEIIIENISKFQNINDDMGKSYRVGNGDQISITVWGLPEIFPISNITPDQNLRRVDSNGNIYFPYVGVIKASEKTQNKLRNDLSVSLSKYFTNPQLDVSIARFNSQKVYLTINTKSTVVNLNECSWYRCCSHQ